VLLAVVLSVGLYQTRGHLAGPAPAFALTGLDGREVTLASLKGTPTLLAFWAPWCGVCKTESQNLSWVQKLVGSRARVLSVASAWEDVGQVQAYVHQRGVDYPVLLDTVGLSRTFNVAAFPTVYFLDEEGNIKGSVVGYTSTLGLLARLLR
jgi:thiol-disulfide isomerase/thioredoxin